jgi:predicted oxidoreductase
LAGLPAPWVLWYLKVYGFYNLAQRLDYSFVARTQFHHSLFALFPSSFQPLAILKHSLANQSCLDDGTLDQCLSSKITPLAWSPLAKGRLTGEPRSAQEASLFQILDSTALRHGVSRATIALAWLLKHPSRMIPIIGTTNPNRITEAIAAEKVQLSREEWYALLIAARGMPIP